MTDIELVNVVKRYGHVEVCKDINLSILAGEFVTLLGSSGCGKTTTLNMIAGLDEVTSGDIVMGGRRVNDLPPSERNVAMVFQNYALYPHMSVAQNIGFALRLKGTDPASMRKRVEAVAELLELNHLLDRYPAQLSGGQQQRVAIGRAIVRSPKVFLFDEPFSNLDASLRVKMRGDVRELHRRLSVTSVFVTHDQEEAMSISDRIAVMHSGIVEQFGTPEDIYLEPRTTYVANFIGNPQVEVSRAAIENSGGKSVCRIGAAAIALDDDIAAALHRYSGDIDIAVRPEFVTLGTGIEAIARLVQPVGHATLVTLDWPGGRTVARVPGMLKIAPGSPVRFSIDSRKLMFFDRLTGLRIATPSIPRG